MDGIKNYIKNTRMYKELKVLSGTIWAKRASLVIQLVISYADIALDLVNSVQLFFDGEVAYGMVMFSLVVFPSTMTWAFLRANGSAPWSDLPVVMFQLAPLREFRDSWNKGKGSEGYIWYIAAEGLCEAPLSGLFTAYILTFGEDQTGATFYISFIWSTISMAKAAVNIHFYKKDDVQLLDKAAEFASRWPMIVLRITTLACFAYVMKEPCVAGGNEVSGQRAFTQTAVFAALLSSASITAALIQAVEPRCPVFVNCFFSTIMLFTTPLGFLSCFERMKTPFALYRCVEIFCLITISVNPLRINPRAEELLKNSPFLVYLAGGSGLGLCLAHLARYGWDKYQKHKRHKQRWADKVYPEAGSSPKYPGDLGEIGDIPSEVHKSLANELASAQDRAKLTQSMAREFAKEGDVLMTNLYVNLEGADLKDPLLASCGW